MISNDDFLQQFDKQVNLETYVLDTIVPGFALFRQKQSLQTQPQHCFTSLRNMTAFRS